MVIAVLYFFVVSSNSRLHKKISCNDFSELIVFLNSLAVGDSLFSRSFCENVIAILDLPIPLGPEKIILWGIFFVLLSVIPIVNLVLLFLYTQPSNSHSKSQLKNKISNEEIRLEELKSMLDRKVISEEEYNSMRKKTLGL